ncbi:hypothetical protein HPP92_010797 [Vanilla planifolia]|uniref:Uncharacterized protein n=1 Tax=Vanilla planifolia TaxID=51239 RepID=A0A835R334_VANPL|nr:hypothetical protein HPP92_010797 [Vanilla planifolia]
MSSTWPAVPTPATAAFSISLSLRDLETAGVGNLTSSATVLPLHFNEEGELSVTNLGMSITKILPGLLVEKFELPSPALFARISLCNCRDGNALFIMESSENPPCCEPAKIKISFPDFAAVDIFASTDRRQMGQVEWELNHISMHSRWNPWRQPGRIRVASPSKNSDRQTAQSMPSPESTELKVMMGMELSTAESRGKNGLHRCRRRLRQGGCGRFVGVYRPSSGVLYG